MCLPKPDVDRFYRVWKSLLFYANEQYQMVPRWEGATLETTLIPEDVFSVRDRIWQDDQMLEQFVAQNPARLSDADLALAASWKLRRRGDFFVLKVLKNHAIFIAQDKTNDVLAVKGLYSSFSNIFPYIPILVVGVLLPYEGEITTDGLFQTYSVSFGRGITGELNDVYADAKERGEIITSLVPSAAPMPLQERIQRAEATNKKVLADFEKYLLHASSSLKIVERDMATVHQLAFESLNHPAGPLSLRDLSAEGLSAFIDHNPTETRRSTAVGVKRFVQFMRDTGRIKWNEAEEMLLILKG